MRDDENNWDERLASLQEMYRFYISNPDYTKGVEYSMWYLDGGKEYPILSSNTGGFPAYYSASEEFGHAIKPTKEFFHLLGLGFHEAMSFTPSIFFEGYHFMRRVNSLYGGYPRKYEAWMAAKIIDYACHPENKLIPEFKPLVEWMSDHSELGVPVLENGDE